MSAGEEGQTGGKRHRRGTTKHSCSSLSPEPARAPTAQSQQGGGAGTELTQDKGAARRPRGRPAQPFLTAPPIMLTSGALPPSHQDSD